MGSPYVTFPAPGSGSRYAARPALAVTGILDVRWKLNVPSFSPTTAIAICANWDGGNNGISIEHGTSGVYSRYGNGSTARAAWCALTGVTGGVPHEFRLTIPIDGSVRQLYVDGVAHSTGTTAPGAGSASAADLKIGRFSHYGGFPLSGDLYYVEIANNGTVVARFDAADVLIANLFALNIPNGLTWTGEDGATWTANGADLDVSGEFALTDYLETELADHILGTGAYTMPTDVYLKLHIGDPGESAALNAAVEATRKVLTFGVAAAGVALNDAAATWTNVSTTETYTHWSLWDDVSAGNPLVYGSLTYPVAATAGDTIQLPVGGLSVKAR